MTSAPDAGAATPAPPISSTLTLSQLPTPQTANFLATLHVSGTPFTTVTVQNPVELGVVFGKDQQQTAKFGEAAKTDGILTLSFVANPPNFPSIIFQSGDTVASTSTDSRPSSGAAAGASASSALQQESATKTTSDTATSVTISHSSSQPANSGKEISTGALAGVAIGCLAAGALIACFILWVCWRRRSAPRTQYSQTNTYATASNEKGFSANAIPLTGQRSSKFASGNVLPQPLEDKAISGDISKISNAIKNHVQSFYHTSRVSPDLIDYDDLQVLGSNLPISVGTLTELMRNATTREIALRFIIAWVIVSKIQPAKDPSKSLLPSEVANCYHVIATGDGGHQAQASLTARWRVMTAELMQSSYVRDPFSPTDSRNASIQATLATLDNVLQPYADTRMNNGERKRNLEEMLKRAALFAFTLFSQPSVWAFEWQEEHGVTSADLCIFPALVQVADEASQPVSPPRPFSEAVVRQLDA